MSEFEIDRYTFRTLPDNQTAELIAWDYRDAVEPGSYEPLFIPPIANGKQVVSIGENAFDMPTRSSLDLVNRQCDGPINQPKDVIVPETVKQLKAHAFYRQLPFHQIFLPRSLTDIDEQALDIYDYYQSTWYIVHEGSLAEKFVQSHELKHYVYPHQTPEFDLSRWEAYMQIARCSIDDDGALLLPRSESRLLLTNALDYFSSVRWEDGSPYYEWNGGFHPHGGVLSDCKYDRREKAFIPEGVTEIGSACYYHNCHVESVFLPNSLQRIERSAFGWCKKLTQVSFSPQLQSIGPFAFEACDSLRSVRFPASLEALEGGCFGFCKSLETVFFEASHQANPQTLPPLRIEATVFMRCPLRVIRLPERTVSISHGIFANCDQLRAVYLPASLKEIHEKAFDAIPPSCLIYVKPGSFAAQWTQEHDLEEKTRIYETPYEYE